MLFDLKSQNLLTTLSGDLLYSQTRNDPLFYRTLTGDHGNRCPLDVRKRLPNPSVISLEGYGSKHLNDPFLSWIL